MPEVAPASWVGAKQDAQLITLYRAKFLSLLGRVNWRSVVADYNTHNPQNPFAWAEAKLPDLLGDKAAELLKDLYYESTWLGYAAGKAQIERSAQKAAKTDIDWGGWTPGDPLAAEKLIGTKDLPGLKQLLDNRFITIKGIEGTRYTELGNMLALGLSRGDSTDATAKSIADRFEKSRGWADVVARTETRAAVTAATRDSYAEGQIEMIEWLTADGGCDICGGFEDMGPVPIDEGFDGLDGPPAHPNCLCVLVPVVGESAAVIPTDEIDDVLEPDEAVEVSTQVTGEDLPEVEMIGNTYDITRKDVEWSEQKYTDVLGQAAKDTSSQDKIGAALNNTVGYDGLPHVVDAETIEALVKEQGWSDLYRGVSSASNGTAEDFAEQFKNGDFYAGWGVFGNGTYTAQGLEMIDTAVAYSKLTPMSDGVIMRMALNPDAKIGDWDTLKTQWRIAENNASPIEKIVIGDLGNWAITQGYDAIQVYNMSYTVILNRTAVAVQNTNWTP